MDWRYLSESFPEEGLRPGHFACPGCGMAIAIRLVLKAVGRCIVVAIPGCNAVIGNTFPYSAFNYPAFHSAFEIAAPTAGGISRGFLLRGGGYVPVVAFAGDGGTFDIGLQALSGACDRNEDMIYVCLDNEAYMNTGIQSSSSTPPFAWTMTTPLGRSGGKKRIMEIVAAHRIPYAATASIAFPSDLMEKTKRASELRGTRFLYILTPCPTGWRMSEDLTIRAAFLAVHCKVHPLYEIVDGKYRLNVMPKGLPIREYLSIQGRYRHLKDEQVEVLQQEIDRDWERLLRLCQ